MESVPEGVKLVDDLVAWFVFEIVDTRNIEEEVKAEFVAAEFADRAEGFGLE